MFLNWNKHKPVTMKTYYLFDGMFLFLNCTKYTLIKPNFISQVSANDCEVNWVVENKSNYLWEKIHLWGGKRLGNISLLTSHRTIWRRDSTACRSMTFALIACRTYFFTWKAFVLLVSFYYRPHMALIPHIKAMTHD